MKSLEYAKAAAQAASDKMGVDIIALDVRQLTTLADIFLFVGATSHVHVRALEDAVREGVAPTGLKLIRTDGQRGHLWRVLDFGSLLVHIMEQKTREFYAVERLWNAAKQVQVLDAPVALPKHALPLPKRAKTKKSKAKKKRFGNKRFAKRRAPVKRKKTKKK